MKSCLNCIHREICKVYHGEMIRREYDGKDFVAELNNLRKELAETCPEYEDRDKRYLERRITLLELENASLKLER